MSPLRVTMLGSGSSGNALVIDNGRVRVMIDAGFGCRALATRLAATGYAPESMSALVLTHEHVDHAHGAMSAARRWNWPIHASAGTVAAVRREDARKSRDAQRKRDAITIDRSESSERSVVDAWEPAVPVALHAIGHGPLSIESLTFEAHAVSHDATQPVGFVVTDTASGARAGIAVDLGHAPASLVSAFSGLDLLVIESNHDLEMLRNGPYPASLKRRIASRHGHLSNRDAGQFAASCAHRGLRHVVLAHLSETNNRPEHAVRTVRGALSHRGWSSCHVSAATQRSVSTSVAVSSGGFAPARAVQLQLL